MMKISESRLVIVAAKALACAALLATPCFAQSSDTASLLETAVNGAEKSRRLFRLRDRRKVSLFFRRQRTFQVC